MNSSQVFCTSLSTCVRSKCKGILPISTPHTTIPAGSLQLTASYSKQQKFIEKSEVGSFTYCNCTDSSSNTGNQRTVIKSFSHKVIEAFTHIPQNNSPQKQDVHITLPLLAGRALRWTALPWQMLACLSLLGNSELLHFWSGLPEISSVQTN